MDKVYLEYRKQLERQAFENKASIMGDEESESGITTFAQLSTKHIRKDEALTNKEKHYLMAVERADIATVKSLLDTVEEDKSFNANCCDPLGRSALLIAIEYENMEMMEVLLSYNVAVNDALLHAINEESVEAVQILLKHIQNISQTNQESQAKEKITPQHMTDKLSATDTEQSDSFTPDITPLMLAAHRDNYEIIKILLERGDAIQKPHPVQCSCKECVTYSYEDILCHSRSRINAYKALASPSLICLSSRDPILTSFELSWELKTLSKLEPEFRTAYVKLSQQVSSFATELLDQTRGSEELEVILNHDTETPMSVDEHDRMALSRLKLAIKYKQKEFVAHPHCQQLLASIWYEGLPGFRRQHIAYKILMTFIIGLLAPIWSILYILAPRSRFGFLKKPFIKFIVHSATYFVFLFLLILTSQRIGFEDPKEVGGEYKMKKEVRGPPPSIIEWIIIAFVAGLIWAEVKQLWAQGAKEYIHDMWNLLDFITNALYLATITLRLVAYIKVQEELRLGLPSALLPRSSWNAYDPNLIAEALFASANTFSTLKLVYIFSINPYLGPLQISLGRMIIDITKWAVVSILVLFSFACGLNQLLWYYSLSNSKECEIDEESALCNSKFLRFFSDLFQIMQTLYWAIFGLVDLDTITLREDHSFTEFAGRTMFGVYSYIIVIVLLNLLIAMMNNSYQNIWSQADVEWKFARCKLWLSYFEEGGTVPAPFNIIPTPKSVWYALLWIKNTLCCCSKKVKQNKRHSLRKIMKKINEREARYEIVMRNLIRRYIMNKSRDKIDEGVTEDDINEIKQDVSSFRYELLGILKTNGMHIPENEKKAQMSTTGNAMKIKRKHSYMKQWQKQVAKAEDGLETSSMNSSTDSLSVMNNNESMADVKSNMKEGTKFPLKRSQSAVSFSTVVKDQLMQKTIGLGKLQGGTLKQWIQNKSNLMTSSYPSTSATELSDNKLDSSKGLMNRKLMTYHSLSAGSQPDLGCSNNRKIFTLSEESD